MELALAWVPMMLVVVMATTVVAAVLAAEGAVFMLQEIVAGVIHLTTVLAVTKDLRVFVAGMSTIVGMDVMADFVLESGVPNTNGAAAKEEVAVMIVVEILRTVMKVAMMASVSHFFHAIVDWDKKMVYLEIAARKARTALSTARQVQANVGTPILPANPVP